MKKKSAFVFELILISTIMFCGCLIEGSYAQTEIEISTRLSESIQVIGADHAWAAGYTGAGWYVAILDTGIRRDHEFFAGKKIVEACFSSSGDCPGGGTAEYGTGAAAHYESSYPNWDRGTHIAGIAAGERQNGSLAGVARDADIIAVQVFSRSTCSGTPCLKASQSDQVQALQYINSKRNMYNIAAVIMVGDGDNQTVACDGDPRKAAIDTLKISGIATIVASGDQSLCGGLNAPACVSNAIAVGASAKNDVRGPSSNVHSTLQDFFAPGLVIFSSTADSAQGYAYRDGTAMAAAHVAGAWALIKQKVPLASVDAISNALTTTGINIPVACMSSSKPRIQVDSALNTFNLNYLLWTK